MTINSVFSKFFYMVQHVVRGTGEMSQRLKTYTTSVENPSLVPSTHIR